MAWTIATEVKQAGMNGIAALFNSGFVELLSGGAAQLARPVFNATAFGAATNASPSVATANAFTADTSITAGTIATVKFQSSGAADLITGSVGVGSGDFQVTDNVIPGTATSVTLSALTMSLQIT